MLCIFHDKFVLQDPSEGVEDARLAEARSPLGVRILRLDVDMDQQLLVCGDRTGNVLAFHFDAACLHSPGEMGPASSNGSSWSRWLHMGSSCSKRKNGQGLKPLSAALQCHSHGMPSVAGSHAKMPLIAVLKHAHQSLPVSLVSISPEGSLATASHEGNIQHYMFSPPASPSSTDRTLRSKFDRNMGSSGPEGVSEGGGHAEGAEAAGSDGIVGKGSTHDVVTALDRMQSLSVDDTLQESAGISEVLKETRPRHSC